MFLFPFPEYLRVRSHDPEEAIRHDVIVSIVTAAKKDLSLVNDALLNYVKERTLDKRVSHVFFFFLILVDNDDDVVIISIILLLMMMVYQIVSDIFTLLLLLLLFVLGLLI